MRAKLVLSMIAAVISLLATNQGHAAPAIPPPAASKVISAGGVQNANSAALWQRVPNLGIVTFQPPASFQRGARGEVTITVQNKATVPNNTAANYHMEVGLSSRDYTGQSLFVYGTWQSLGIVYLQNLAASARNSQTLNFPVPLAPPFPGNLFVCAQVVQSSPAELDVMKNDNIVCRPIALSEPPPSAVNPNLAVLNLESPPSARQGETIRAAVTLKNMAQAPRNDVTSYMIYTMITSRDYTGQRDLVQGTYHTYNTLNTGAALPANERRVENISFAAPPAPFPGNNFLCARVSQTSPMERAELQNDNIMCRPIVLSAPLPSCPLGRLSYTGTVETANQCNGALAVTVNMKANGEFDGGSFSITPNQQSGRCVVVAGDDLHGHLRPASSSFTGHVSVAGTPIPISFSGTTRFPGCDRVSGRFSISAPVNDSGSYHLEISR